MGLPKEKLWVTNTSDPSGDILLSAYKPIKKEDGKYLSRNFCVSLTPEHRAQIPFLKYIGYSKYTLVPVLEDIKVNVGLVARFSQVDLHEFAQKLSIRKPRTHKYGKDGKRIIRKTSN